MQPAVLIHSVNPLPITAFTCSTLLSFLSSPILLNYYKSLLRERERERYRLIVCCMAMDDNKRAAKAFIDQYFPLKDQPSSKATADAFGELFLPPDSKKSLKKQGHGSTQSLNPQTSTADGKYRGSAKKSQSKPQKASSVAEHCEISEPCLMSSSVDYGCRDNYPYNPDSRYPGPSYYTEKDGKDGYDSKNPEYLGTEWWQGSFYY